MFSNSIIIHDHNWPIDSCRTDVVLGAYYLEEKSFNNYNSKRVNYTIKGFNYSAEVFLVEIESIKVHENYTKRIVKNDIALIKLKQNISSLVITKIPLNNESESSEPLSINKIDLNTSKRALLYCTLVSQ